MTNTNKKEAKRTWKYAGEEMVNELERAGRFYKDSEGNLRMNPWYNGNN